MTVAAIQPMDARRKYQVRMKRRRTRCRIRKNSNHSIAILMYSIQRKKRKHSSEKAERYNFENEKTENIGGTPGESFPVPELCENRKHCRNETEVLSERFSAGAMRRIHLQCFIGTLYLL